MEIPTITSHLKHLEGFSFSDEMITLQNYCDFHQFFKDNYNKLENELNNRGTLTKKRLEKMISEFCSKNGTKITNRQLEIFIYILDINGKNKRK